MHKHIKDTLICILCLFTLSTAPMPKTLPPTYDIPTLYTICPVRKIAREEIPYNITTTYYVG